MDTPSKQAKTGLVKPKPKEVMTRRIDKNALNLYSKDKGNSAEDHSSDKGINAKTFSVQNRRERPVRCPSPKNEPPIDFEPKVDNCPLEDVGDSSSTSSNREASGVNKDLCSLAQSFFDGGKTKKPPPQRRISATNPISSKTDTPSPSSTLSSLSSQSTQGKQHERRSYPLPPERAYFQPNSSAEMVDEEDDFEIPSLPNRIRKDHSSGNNGISTGNTKSNPILLKTPSQIHKERSPSSPEDAPPIPERSAQPKMMMLKLMKNATNALKNN